MKNTSPYGLDQWLQFLTSKKFPVKSASLARLKNQVRSNGNSLDGIQTSIAKEPLLAFAILNEANRIVSNKENEITSPLHAAALIGMNGLERAFANCTAYEIKKSNSAELSTFLHQIQTSYEAATMAKFWAIEKLSGNEEDVFWTTLFRDSVKWLLWFHAHSTMEKIETRIQQGEKAGQTELEVLGCQIDELTIHFYKHCHASQKVINSFLQKNIPNKKEMQSLASLLHHPDELPEFTEDRRLTILINNPLILTYCANKVAHEANRSGWSSKHLTFYYRVIAAIMHRPIGKIIQIAHLSSREAAIFYRQENSIPLVFKLLDPTLYTEKKTKKKIKKKTLPTTDALQKSLSKSKDLSCKEKGNLALKAIKSSIPNTKNCIVFQVGSVIKPVYQSGYDSAIIKNIEWNNSSTIFTKLCQTKSTAHLFGNNLTKLLKNFPDTADEIINNDSHLLLASTQATETEKLILWLETHTRFNENDYTNLKKIVSLISHAAT